MVSRRYWPGVLLTLPIGIALGFWVGAEMDRLYTPVGAASAFLVSSVVASGGTALGAMVGGLIATRRVDAPVGSSVHVLGVGTGAAIGALGFWTVLVVTVVLLGGILALQFFGLGIVFAVAAGLLSAAAVATADLAARLTRRLAG